MLEYNPAWANSIWVDDLGVMCGRRIQNCSSATRGSFADKAEGCAAVPSALYRERYPAMTALDTDYGPPGRPAIVGAAFKCVPPEGNIIARNVGVGKRLR
jgi:hypothetical protein